MRPTLKFPSVRQRCLQRLLPHQLADRLAIAAAVVLLGSAGVEAQLMAPLNAPPTGNVHYQAVNRIDAPIRTVQGAIPGDKPLPAPIAAMPDIAEELDVIHRRSQLIVTRDNVVRMAIADPSVIDVVQYSPNEISIIGLDRGSTTLTLWFEDGTEPLIYLIRVVQDPSLDEQRRLDYGKLEKKLAVLFPNSKVFLIPLSQKIIVKGQARDAEEASRILSIVRGEVINQYGGLLGPQQPGAVGAGVDVGFNNNNFGQAGALDQYSSYIVDMLDVPGETQVMLHVRIAELKRSQLREMGVDLDVLIDGGKIALSTTLAGAGGAFSGIFNDGEINVLLNWLASNGTAKILTEPTLTVLSGHSASFLSGGEFAVPTIVGVGGAQGTSTTFRGFGTSLIVTPMVINKDLIRMQIVPEFSAIDNGNSVGGIPGVNTRRVQTTVELREGQTLALAGLLSSQSNTEVTRIPFLGSLPLVGGPLFNAKRASQDQTELLILVTPEIVRPMEADEVPPVPGHEVTHPTDSELYFHAMTEGVPDQRVYQLPPYGNGTGYGHEVGYHNFNPAPASPMYSPVPTNPYGAGTPSSGYQQPVPYQMPAGGMPLPPGGMPHNPQGFPQSPGYPNRQQLVPLPEPAMNTPPFARPAASGPLPMQHSVAPAYGSPRYVPPQTSWGPERGNITPASYEQPASAPQPRGWGWKLPSFRKTQGPEYR